MFVALLLAAGSSSRMGRSKLDLDLGGRSVFERALDVLLASPVDRVVVVLPAIRERALPATDRVRSVTNPHPEEGIASSIRVGVAAVHEGTRAVLVALADKPLVKPETVSKLLSRFERGDVQIVYPTYRGNQGHPVLLARELFPELGKLEGDSGAKSLLHQYGERAAGVETEDPGILLDIDTPEDYANCLKRLEE
jgi:CTP:molybdopterin cytidylyltransferase MocA